MPQVPPNFDWPTKDGYPLAFIGQLHCGEIDLLPSAGGDLLFFYDNRHWGSKPKDIGHAVVIHIPEGITRHESVLPTRTISAFFGLMNKRVSPKRYQRINVQFKLSTSYPGTNASFLPFRTVGSMNVTPNFVVPFAPTFKSVDIRHPSNLTIWNAIA